MAIKSIAAFAITLYNNDYSCQCFGLFLFVGEGFGYACCEAGDALNL